MRNASNITLLLPPVLADALGIILYLDLAPTLQAQLSDKMFSNSLLLGLFFAIFCFALYLNKKLAGGPAALDLTPHKRVIVALALPLTFYVVTAIADTVGFLDSVLVINNQLLDETGATLYLLLTPASWLAIALIYPMMLSGPLTGTIPAGTLRFFGANLLSLIGVNLLIIALAAFSQIIWDRWLPDGAPALQTAGILIFYIILFLPTRLPLVTGYPRRALLVILPLLLFLGYLAVALVYGGPS